MKRILFTLAVMGLAAQAQAVIVTTPPTRQVVPFTQPNMMAPAPVNVQPQPGQQPVYYENGRPVYANQPQNNGGVQTNNCQDRGGNYIPCPMISPANTTVNGQPGSAPNAPANPPPNSGTGTVYPSPMGNNNGVRY